MRTDLVESAPSMAVALRGALPAVGKYVMSEVQTLSSSPRSNRRLTRSLGRCASRSTTVVTGVNFRGLIPARRWRRIEAATVLREITSPSSRRSARMRGAPYT